MLIKEGVSKVLNKPFCFYALGGANDISILEGHSYTYEGATCGRLVEMLMESKVMNPIIFFDELDKISGDEKGNNIENLIVDFNMENKIKSYSPTGFFVSTPEKERVIWDTSLNADRRFKVNNQYK